MSFKDFVSNSNFSPSSDTPTNSASDSQVSDVISKVIASYKYDPADSDSVKVNICGLLQSGATSPKFDQNKSLDLLGNGKKVEVKVLKKASTDVASNLTLRKIARALRDDIIIVSLKADISGNLSKRFLVDHADATPDELICASDFQTFNNLAPDRVKNWLIANFQNRFGTKS